MVCIWRFPPASTPSHSKPTTPFPNDKSLSTNFSSNFREDAPENQTLICFSSIASHALRDAGGFFSGLEGDWREFVELQGDGWIVGPRGQLSLWVPLTHH
ncbi:hypothetical protein F5141DRAFT_1012340 [Pisolithus sp. B1]|nr:hypothetical protein F5141DRAFT_1012340 [Pisolithus sp. B1]